MNLKKFLSLDKEAIILPEEAQSFNDYLAKISTQDIPINHRAQIIDYLIISLNLDSVEHDIRPKLDLLLTELQTCA